MGRIDDQISPPISYNYGINPKGFRGKINLLFNPLKGGIPMKTSALQKQKEALLKKLSEIENKEKELAKAEKEKAIAEAKAAIEKSKTALAALISKYHLEDFVNFDAATFIGEVRGILGGKKKEKKPKKAKPVAVVAPVAEAAAVPSVVAETDDVVESAAATETETP